MNATPTARKAVVKTDMDSAEAALPGGVESEPSPEALPAPLTDLESFWYSARERVAFAVVLYHKSVSGVIGDLIGGYTYFSLMTSDIPASQ